MWLFINFEKTDSRLRKVTKSGFKTHYWEFVIQKYMYLMCMDH